MHIVPPKLIIMTFYKHIFTVFLFTSLAFAHSSCAQSKWSLGPVAAVSYNSLEDKYYDPGVGYNAGFSSMRFFTPHVFASAGLSYAKKSFTLSGIPDTRDLFSGGGIRYYSMNYSLSYLSVPLEVGYSFFDLANHKFSITASGGVLLNALLYEKLKSKDLDPTFSDKRDDNSFSASVHAGIGLLYNISSRFFLMVSPRYSYDFYASKTNGFSNEIKFHSISLQASIQYKLGK